MSQKALRAVCASTCAFFCILAVAVVVNITGSMLGEENGAFERVAAAYEARYEEALQNYSKRAESRPTSVGASSAAISPVSEPGVTDPSGLGPSEGNISSVSTTPVTDTGSTGSGCTTDSASSQQQGNHTSTAPDKGDSGSSETSVKVDNLSPDGTEGVSDEAAITPASGTLPSYSSICVKDNDGKWVYIVKRGDTLTKISGLVGYSVQHLAEYNHITNLNLIYSGQAIRIPCD